MQLSLLHGFASETFSGEMDRLFNDAGQMHPKKTIRKCGLTPLLTGGICLTECIVAS